MARSDLRLFLRGLTRGMAAESLTDLSDAELVEKAILSHDESAFDAIVRRHAQMVYRVCWRTLQHRHDAEDAFQATFLVLAKRIVSVRKRESLASWLYGVARRVALKAKAHAAGRRHHERRANTIERKSLEEATWLEMQAVLDCELAALPEKWRQPLVLCHLEGWTQDEAAKQLKWSKRTIRRRLEEARNALARRLRRRGVVLSTALAGVLVSDCAAPAMPPELLQLAIHRSASLATNNMTSTSIPVHVAALTEGVTTAMPLIKIKIAIALIPLLVIVGFGVSMHSSSMFAENQSGDQKNESSGQDGKKAGISNGEKEQLDSNLKQPRELNDVKFEGKIGPDDPRHKVYQVRHQVHTIRMTGGKTYQIKLTSKAFSIELVLEDSAGKKLASDGNDEFAQIIFEAPKDDTYRIIVGSFDDRVGDYTLKVGVPSKADLAFAKVDREFQEALDAALKRSVQAKTQVEKDRARKQFFEDAIPLFERLSKVAHDYPGDQGAAESMQAATQYLFMLRGADSPVLAKALRSLIDQCSIKHVQGLAAVTLTHILRNQYEKAYENKDPRASALYQDAERTLTETSKKFSDTSLLMQLFKETLFDLQHLSIGKQSPEIEGEDFDGKKFKLSDYRGKVVVLTFWSGWCAPCMALIPHEVALVKRLKNAPFVMIGVNGDEDREALKKTANEKGITWRSFWNGGPRGPITTAWGVHSWPAIYVLDSIGMIRFRGVRGEEMDRAVDALLAEIENSKK